MQHFGFYAVKSLVVGVLVVLMLSTTSLAQDQDEGATTLSRVVSSNVLRVGVNPNFKPFSFEQDGKRVGVDIDIANLLAEKLGVKVEFFAPESFSDLIPMLQANQIDIIIAGMSITFDRAKAVDFSVPYFETGLSILLNKVRAAKLGIGDAKDHQTIYSILEKNGKANRLVIAVTDGKAPQQVVPRYFPQASMKAYPTNEAAAAATLKGDADMMVHDEIFLKVWLKEHMRDARYRLVVIDPPFKPDYYGMAVRKGNQDLLNMLAVFNLELKSDGNVSRFLGQYLPVTTRVVTRSYTISEDYYGGD
ncbi:amino acid ABC transporter substrate-binding protein [Desulfosarcina ovata subsp. sediminis]|uniref:Amino acid ABC transporter substrate-binding protein n=1 Tax=Desulfosarcina ovata subsp. sediminis TaxID=885957 RepID=A0A5K7ZXI7_9BACT|nr:transporter substrate-binding domain-containing protein [Desulfosarcina ovata]BBO84962.1 amino acid ABC transporter substrate-binding protein [Desulfosarcina ovata subsp. sediminis]